MHNDGTAVVFQDQIKGVERRERQRRRLGGVREKRRMTPQAVGGGWSQGVEGRFLAYGTNQAERPGRICWIRVSQINESSGEGQGGD